VVFEFFQNAVDKAKHCIDIVLQPSAAADGTHRLLIANDGDPVTINGLSAPVSVQFPLVSGGMGEALSRFAAGRPSDFQALCNIHISSKQAGQSIGNKSVGFKSAWEFARQVTVMALCWQRCHCRWSMPVNGCAMAVAFSGAASPTTH
jgi:hypothetical protein